MRNTHDLSHIIHVAGHIGRLQTLCVIPVIAGDSLSLNLNGIFRLAPTRKEIVSECMIDICAFFVPHRHVYPIEWPKVVAEGLQNVSGLTAGPSADVGSRDPFYLGVKTVGAIVNKFLVYGYNEIYRRYFAVPTTNQNGTFVFTNTTFYPNGSTVGIHEDFINTRKYGMRAARLPHILNGAILVNQTNAGGFNRNQTIADYGVQIPQDTPSAGIALLDIRDLKAIQSRYRSTQEQNWFAQFYNDVIRKKWNTGALNTDADPRPTYLGRDTHFVSGTDVNGTDDATLGTYVGKTLDRVQFNMPRRYMPEHGCVWVMMLPRFPLIHTDEQHPTLVNSGIDLKILQGDPKVWEGEKPIAFNPGNWMAGGSIYTPNIQAAQQPYGQELRYQPNRVHPVFKQIPGYPFTTWDTATPYDWYYYKNNEFGDVFQTSQIGQWQSHIRAQITKQSVIPGASGSIMAGA